MGVCEEHAKELGKLQRRGRAPGKRCEKRKLVANRGACYRLQETVTLHPFVVLHERF